MNIFATMLENWQYWFVTAFVIVAAYIDGKELRVPNKITYPMIIGGWIYSMIAYQISGEGWYVGLGWSLAGTAVGVGYPVTRLFNWWHGSRRCQNDGRRRSLGLCLTTFYAFCVSAVVGAILAVAMIIWSGEGKKHWNQFFYIFNEIATIRNPETLAGIAAERKSSMRLLPYGIPLAIGTVMYFAWMGIVDLIRQKQPVPDKEYPPWRPTSDFSDFNYCHPKACNTGFASNSSRKNWKTVPVTLCEVIGIK